MIVKKHEFRYLAFWLNLVVKNFTLYISAIPNCMAQSIFQELKHPVF